MPTTYIPADDETLALAIQIIEEHHPRLLEARIALVFREGDAPLTNGKEILGQASLVNSKMKVIAKEDFDFFIWLAGDWWHNARDNQRKALLDHELCHCTGQPYAWKMRSHDVEEFACILERHGPWYQDLHNFVKVSRETPILQGRLGVTPPNGKVGTIESITLSTNNRSVTLTADTARKAQAAMEASIA